MYVYALTQEVLTQVFTDCFLFKAEVGSLFLVSLGKNNGDRPVQKRNWQMFFLTWAIIPSTPP